MKPKPRKSTARPASGRRLSTQAMANRRKSQAEARRAQTRQGQDIADAGLRTMLADLIRGCGADDVIGVRSLRAALDDKGGI